MAGVFLTNWFGPQASSVYSAADLDDLFLYPGGVAFLAVTLGVTLVLALLVLANERADRLSGVAAKYAHKDDVAAADAGGRRRRRRRRRRPPAATKKKAENGASHLRAATHAAALHASNLELESAARPGLSLRRRRRRRRRIQRAAARVPFAYRRWSARSSRSASRPGACTDSPMIDAHGALVLRRLLPRAHRRRPLLPRAGVVAAQGARSTSRCRASSPSSTAPSRRSRCTFPHLLHEGSFGVDDLRSEQISPRSPAASRFIVLGAGQNRDRAVRGCVQAAPLLAPRAAGLSGGDPPDVRVKGGNASRCVRFVFHGQQLHRRHLVGVERRAILISRARRERAEGQLLAAAAHLQPHRPSRVGSQAAAAARLDVRDELAPVIERDGVGARAAASPWSRRRATDLVAGEPAHARRRLLARGGAEAARCASAAASAASANARERCGAPYHARLLDARELQEEQAGGAEGAAPPLAAACGRRGQRARGRGRRSSGGPSGGGGRG